MSKTITLRASDGESFEIDEAVAVQSVTVKSMIDEDSDDTVFPLPNVTGTVLAKVVEFCKKHVDSPKSEYAEKDKELQTWDEEFVKVDQDMLFDLILAANYMNIKELLDLTCKTVADMIKGKSPEEIRKTFHIVNDYTPAEEAEVRRENSWAFE